MIDVRTTLRQVAARSRRASNASLGRSGITEDLVECSQHAARVTLKKVGLRFVWICRILPDVVVGSAGGVVERIALGVVRNARIQARLRVEAAILRSREILVVLAPSSSARGATVFVDVEEVRFHPQPGPLLVRLVSPRGAANVVRMGPVRQAVSLWSPRIRSGVGRVGVARGAGYTLPIHIAHGLRFFEGLNHGNPALDVRHIFRNIGCRHSAVAVITRAVSGVPRVDIPYQRNIALQAGVIAGSCPRTAVGIQLLPIPVDGKTVVERLLTGIGQIQVGHCGRTGRQALQIAERLVVQLTCWIVLLVAPWGGSGAAELVQVVDDATHAESRIAVRIVSVDARQRIPFRGRVTSGGRVFATRDVISSRANKLHGGTKHAAVAATFVAVPAKRLFERIAERRQSQLVVVLLNRSSGLVIAVGIAGAQVEVTLIHQVGTALVADLRSCVEKPIGIQRCATRARRGPRTRIVKNVATLADTRRWVGKRGIVTTDCPAKRGNHPAIACAIPNLLDCGRRTSSRLCSACWWRWFG